MQSSISHSDEFALSAESSRAAGCAAEGAASLISTSPEDEAVASGMDWGAETRLLPQRECLQNSLPFTRILDVYLHG